MKETTKNDKYCIFKDKKITTTKKILWLSWGLFIALVIANILGLNVGSSVEIIGGVSTSVTTGFYLWKSKCENKHKIAVTMIEELADKYGIENVTNIIGTILNE